MMNAETAALVRECNRMAVFAPHGIEVRRLFSRAAERLEYLDQALKVSQDIIGQCCGEFEDVA